MTKKELLEAIDDRLIPEIMSLELTASDPFWKYRGFSKEMQADIKNIVSSLLLVMDKAKEEVENMELEDV